MKPISTCAYIGTCPFKVDIVLCSGSTDTQDMEKEKMTIKTEIAKDKSLAQDYPCVKIGELQTVVLFIEPNTGIVLHQGDSSRPFGVESTWWAEDVFKPFKGTITITVE